MHELMRDASSAACHLGYSSRNPPRFGGVTNGSSGRGETDLGEQFRSFVPDDVVAREMYQEGRAPHREIGVEVIPLGARQDLPRPIAASGRRRSSRCVADKHWSLLVPVHVRRIRPDTRCGYPLGMMMGASGRRGGATRVAPLARGFRGSGHGGSGPRPRSMSLCATPRLVPSSVGKTVVRQTSPSIACGRLKENGLRRVLLGGLRSGGVAWWSRVVRATGAPRSRCRGLRGVRLPRVLGHRDVGRAAFAASGVAGLESRGVRHRRREVCGVRAAGTTPPGAIGAIAERRCKGAARAAVGPAPAGKRPPVLVAPAHEGCGRGERFQAEPVAAHGWARAAPCGGLSGGDLRREHGVLGARRRRWSAVVR